MNNHAFVDVNVYDRQTYDTTATEPGTRFVVYALTISASGLFNTDLTTVLATVNIPGEYEHDDTWIQSQGGFRPEHNNPQVDSVLDFLLNASYPATTD